MFSIVQEVWGGATAGAMVYSRCVAVDQNNRARTDNSGLSAFDLIKAIGTLNAGYLDGHQLIDSGKSMIGPFITPETQVPPSKIFIRCIMPSDDPDAQNEARTKARAAFVRGEIPGFAVINVEPGQMFYTLCGQLP